MVKSNWNTNDITNQNNRVVIVTGATSGLGKEATKILAAKNATVIMAVRNTEKGESVATEFKKVIPDAKIEVRKLDLGSLDSIKTLPEAFSNIDILINNAGVMACPFSKTKDNFEIQMGTNHLGHFALTGLLMPLLKMTKASRIVATSSIAHRQGNINFEDINWERRKYATGKAYADSKLANLYFCYELAKKLFRILNPIIGQNAANGVLPTLRAALDESAKPGDYFGPSGFMEGKGAPIIVRSNEMSNNVVNAKRLWDLSEELTGVKY